MNRRQLAFWGALLPIILIQGCATQPPPPPVPTIDFPTKAGEVLTVTDRIVHFRLPAPGGKLQVWASGDLSWHNQHVNGTLGRAVIGEENGDFGVPFPVRYVVGGQIYEVTVVKRRKL